MTENKKNRVSLSSLTGKNSKEASSPFPSFRFSPENEEIEEILLQQGSGMFSNASQTKLVLCC